MKKFLKYFNNKYAEEHLNRGLKNRTIEEPLYECVLDVFYSIENTGFVKLINWRHITDESKINISRYIVSRKKKKSTGGGKRSKKKKEKLINIHYDRCTLLEMTFRCNVHGEVGYKNVSVLVPKADKDNFFCIKGKKVYLLYQLVNNSTYVTKNSVILKGMMPLCVTRGGNDMTDTNLTKYRVPTYAIKAFKQDFNPLLLFSAKMGIYDALEMFGIAPVLRIVDINEREEEGWTYFTIDGETATKKIAKPKIKIKVSTKLFKKYKYLQSMTGMLYTLLNASGKPDLEKIADRNFWYDEIGFIYTKDRVSSREIGKSTMVFWERMVDRSAKKTLRMKDYNKSSVYNLVVMLIQNFDAFKVKDNNDINNKRLRLNECISALTSLHVGKSVHRILAKGEKVTLEDVMDMLSIQPNLIFRDLYSSQLITYNDIVNDMDFFNGFKYTIKGPNAMGNSSKNGRRSTEKNFMPRDRAVPLSSIGKVDPDVCSSSSPGLGGLVSPYVAMDGLHFDDKEEIQDSQFELIKQTNDYHDGESVHVTIPDTYDKYIEQKTRAKKLDKNFIKIHEKRLQAYIYIDPDVADGIE